MSGIRSLTLLIPTQIVGLLIGKNGKSISEIVGDSDCSLTFQSITDMPTHSTYRILCVMGSKESVLQAISRIIQRAQFMKGHGDSQDLEYHSLPQLMKWIIPQRLCGALIGRGGDGIKKINDISGAWVKVAHADEFHGASERLVYIRGNPEQNRRALRIIIDKVGGRPYNSTLQGPDDGNGKSVTPRGVNSLLVPLPALRVVLGQSITESVFPLSTNQTLAGCRVTIQPQFEGGSLNVLLHLHEDSGRAKALLFSRLGRWMDLCRIEGSNVAKGMESMDMSNVIMSTADSGVVNCSSPLSAATPEITRASMSGSLSGHLCPDVCGLNIAISAHCAEWFERSVTMDEGHFLTSLCTRSGCYVQVLNHSSTASNHCATKEVSVIAPTIANLLLSVSMILDHIELKGEVIPRIPIQIPGRIMSNDIVSGPSAGGMGAGGWVLTGSESTASSRSFAEPPDRMTSQFAPRASYEIPQFPSARILENTNDTAPAFFPPPVLMLSCPRPLPPPAAMMHSMAYVRTDPCSDAPALPVTTIPMRYSLVSPVPCDPQFAQYTGIPGDRQQYQRFF